STSTSPDLSTNSLPVFAPWRTSTWPAGYQSKCSRDGISGCSSLVIACPHHCLYRRYRSPDQLGTCQKREPPGGGPGGSLPTAEGGPLANPDDRAAVEIDQRRPVLDIDIAVIGIVRD